MKKKTALEPLAAMVTNVPKLSSTRSRDIFLYINVQIIHRIIPIEYTINRKFLNAIESLPFFSSNETANSLSEFKYSSIAVDDSLIHFSILSIFLTYLPPIFCTLMVLLLLKIDIKNTLVNYDI